MTESCPALQILRGVIYRTTPSGDPGQMLTPVVEPMRTLTASGSQSLLVPRGAFIIDRRGEYRVRGLADPLSTITANETSKALIVEAAGNTYDMASGSGNNYLRAWPITDPLRTLHGTASKALLIPVEGRDGKRAGSAAEPMRTQTTRNETGLLVPYYSASETAKPTDYPVGTLTTVDRYALVTLRGTNAPKPITDPLDTITASGNHHGLVSITEDDVMACRFRMLEPSEIAAGMSFPSDYRWQGTKRQRVRLAGNAVTPPAARDLIQVGIESIEAA